MEPAVSIIGIGVSKGQGLREKVYGGNSSVPTEVLPGIAPMAPLRWKSPLQRWEFETRGDLSNPTIVPFPVGFRSAHEEEVVGRGLLQTFLRLHKSKDTLGSTLQFFRAFGYPSFLPVEGVQVRQLAEFSAATESLVTLGMAVREKSYDGAGQEFHRGRLSDWVSGWAPRRPDVAAADSLDLSKYKYEDWRIEPGRPLPGLSLSTLQPGGRHLHAVAIPAEIGTAGKDAVAAWLDGAKSYRLGPSQLKGSKVDRLKDAWLVEEGLREWVGYLTTTRAMAWDQTAEPAGQFVWFSEIDGPGSALAMEVLRATTGATVRRCKSCGEFFEPQKSEKGGRPSTQCSICYEPNTPRRQSARRSAAKRKTTQSR